MCAVFNPDSPMAGDNMPDWSNVTKPISQPEANKSAGLRFANIGAALEGGASIVSDVAKDYVKKDIRDTVEPIREDYTNQLLQTKAIVQGADAVVPPSGAGQPLDLLAPGNNVSVPAGIAAGLSKVKGLQNFITTGSGKLGVDETYYDMRLKNAVTDLRVRYPGYVDLIDGEVSKITGMTPANELIRDTTRQIAQLQSTRRSAVDKAMDDAMKSGYHNSEIMLKNLRERGEAFLPEFQQWYAKETMVDAAFKRNEAARKASQGKKEDITVERTETFNKELDDRLYNNFNTITTVAGMNTPMKILDVMQKAAANPDEYTDAQLRQLGVQLQAQKAAFSTFARQHAGRTITTEDGRRVSYNTDITAPKTEEIIKTKEAMYDVIIDALMKGGPGAGAVAFSHVAHAQAILDDTKDNLLSGDNGKWAADVANFRTLFGDNWSNLVISQGLKEDIDKKLRARLSDNKMDARLQRGFSETGAPITMTQHLADMKRLQDQGRVTEGMRSRYTNSLINIVDDIKSKDAPDQDKINVVRYIFSPEGQGLLSKIKTEYIDPDTRKEVPGKYSVWTRLTSPDIVANITKLAQSDPQIGMMYKNWVEREAGAELFKKELLNLNYFTGHDDIKFKYNDGAKGGIPYIEMIPPESPAGGTAERYATGGYGGPNPSYLRQIEGIVGRINTALSGLDRVAKGFGENGSDKLLAFMIRSQVDLGKNWEGLPAKLMEDIANSRKKRKLEDTFGNK